MRRTAVSGITLTVLVVLLVVGAVVGWRALTAPPEPTVPTTTAAPRCDRTIQRGEVVRPRDVRVSVYNAGSRSGLAGQTLDQLTARGFRPGVAGNAPGGLTSVRVVRVLAPTRADPAAQLVAAQFGPRTPVTPVRRNLGRGVDVVVGDGFVGLARAPRQLVARAPGSGC